MLDLISKEDLEHLFQNLPLTALWLTAYGPHPENNQCFSYSPDAQDSSLDITALLAAKSWQIDALSPLQVHRLETDHAAYVYVCTYRETPPPLGSYHRQSMLSGYWLLQTNAPLSALDCYCIEQQLKSSQTSQSTQLLQSQLHRQIDALKQTLHKTEHQLRTPLALVELYADVLQQSVPTPALKDQAQHIGQTVKQIMLSLKRLTRWEDSAQPESIHTQYRQRDLQQLVTDSLEELKPYWLQKALTVTCDGPSLSLKVDHWQIKQAFLNLLNNAIAFSPTGSTLTCHWQVHQNHVLIDICDQGTGFSAEDLAHVFTPFYSQRPNGTGLGLIIARDIIQAHQGQLQASNSTDGGARLTISLPIECPMQDSRKSATAFAVKRPQKQLATVA